MITVPPAAPSELSGWNPALPSPHPLELGLALDPLDRRTGGVTELCSERAAASCSLRCGAPAACCSRRLAARVGMAAALLSASCRLRRSSASACVRRVLSGIRKATGNRNGTS